METRARSQPWWQGNSFNRPQGGDTPYGPDDRARPVGQREGNFTVRPAQPVRTRRGAGGLSRYARGTGNPSGASSGPVRPGPVAPKVSHRWRGKGEASPPETPARPQANLPGRKLSGQYGTPSQYARGTGRLSGHQHKMPDGHMMDDDDSSMKPGGGGRFAALKGKLEKKGTKSPGGLAAFLGRKKYGKGKFQSMAAKGKK